MSDKSSRKPILAQKMKGMASGKQIMHPMKNPFKYEQRMNQRKDELIFRGDGNQRTDSEGDEPSISLTPSVSP